MVPRTARLAAPALILVALAASLFALAYGGGAAPQLVADPGAVVRYGLPIAKLLVNLGAAGTLGALVLVLFGLAPGKPEFDRALDVAAASAAVWTVASAVTAFFTFLAAFLEPVSFDDRFGQLLASFLTDRELGQAWLSTTLIAAAVTVLCFAVRNPTALIAVTALAAIGLYPAASQGHAGGTESHDAAVGAVYLHTVFAAIWLGGLLAIVLAGSTLREGRLGIVLARYSTLALVSFVVVSSSGLVRAQIGIETLANLASPYGVLVLIKVAALIAIGAFGAVQRRALVSRMSGPGPAPARVFWWLVLAELAFMGLASGVAAALARTPPPEVELPAADQADPSPAELLTGRPLPPEPSLERYLTLWNLDLLWVLVCAFLAFFYLAGVWRLRRRGDRWPIHRTVLWLLGIALLFVVTNGAINVYERYLFSVHMLGHMLLGMAIPVLLVPAAPITLALRAIAKRADGSRGPREWLMLAVHSRVAGVLVHPVVAAILFDASLWLFYYSPLFSWATTDHVGHVWMVTHFLITGYLLAQSLIGIDPVPYRAPYPLRLILLLATMGFHAFFGLSLMTGTGLLLADWYGAMGRDWGPSALVDQQTGGGIAWSVGEIPTLVLAVIVAVAWSRSDTKESKRRDRQADRDGDAELEAYNEMLARRARSR